MLARRSIRVFFVLAAFGGGGFAACSSDTFGSATDASTGDAGAEAEADAGSVVEAGADACAGDCQGGACTAGICQPVTLATGLNGPYGLTVHGTSIYVTEFVAHGRVLRFDKSGGPNQTPVVVASEGAMAASISFPSYVSKPFSVGANDGYVAWTDLGGLAATGFSKLFYATPGDAGAPLPDAGGDAGGNVHPLYELCGQGELALDDLHVFWANQANTKCPRPEQNGLFRAAPSNGHSGTVYFPFDAPADGGGISSDGGPSVVPLAVAVDTNHVYVGAGNQLLIFNVDKIDDPNGVTDALLGGTTTLPAAPYAIDTDPDVVAWTDYRASGKVYALPKTAPPNTDPTILAKSQDHPLGVTIDHATNYVYYTLYDGGSLKRVRKDGTGDPQVVLSGLDHPAFLVSDATTLYFTNFGSGSADGTLMRIAKPLP